MAGGIDTSCLYSVVRNDSGRRKTFGFLPPHGRTLDDGEEFSVYGDVRQSVLRFERTEGRKHIIAFEGALQRGDLTILSTPSIILTDDANPGATPKAIRIHNGSLGLHDPCWTGSTSLTPPIG